MYLSQLPVRQLKECLESVWQGNHSYCWRFGIVDQPPVKEFPRGYLGWTEPGHSNAKPFPWKCPNPEGKCVIWNGYGWTGYRPSRWDQRMDEEEEALARLPENLRPKRSKDRTGTYEYQVQKEEKIRLGLSPLQRNIKI
jgi:hypothetical protein